MIGVDVSKARRDVAVRPSGDTRMVRHDEAGIAERVTRLHAWQPAAVVLEATGDLGSAVVSVVAAAGLPVHVVTPRQVRDFARATGGWPRRMRSRHSSWPSSETCCAPRPLPDEATQALSADLSRRRQLMERFTAEQNRLSQARPALRQRITAHIEWLTRELRQVDRELDTAIRHSLVWREQDDLLQRMPGVGPGLSRPLLAELPELGTVSSKQLAALVGVAPHNRDSGTLRGARTIWGGRAVVRTALYLAALAATQWNPLIQAFSHQLLTRGKAKKVALVACMHKRLIILTAMVTHRTPWRANAQQV